MPAPPAPQPFPELAEIPRMLVNYRRGEVVFSRGDRSDSVLFICAGDVRLSLVAYGGKEAIVGVLGPGAFLGEEALAGRDARLETATAMTASTVTIIAKDEMLRLLRNQPAFSDRFLAHILARTARLEQDLADQLLNHSEKRLARALLLLARRDRQDRRQAVLPRISQEMLAEMVGTTRSRVNFFMARFRKRGFIDDCAGGVRVNRSLRAVVMHD